MLVIATDKLTGAVRMFAGVTMYNEMFNPSCRKWFHCLVTPTNTILIDSKQYRISITDTKKGEK